MNTDGTEQTYLIRGSSATWSPDSEHIAFHRSASGDVCTVEDPLDLPPSIPGCPIRLDPGAPTWDSDIFVMNVDDLLPQNLTNSPDDIEDDADWSPDGQRIVFTSHKVSDNQINSKTAEIYVMNADGTGRVALTNNTEEERGPAWSPDGTRIVYNCRKGSNGTFEICVMSADGTNQVRLTNNTVNDATGTWSPDGQQIVWHRNPTFPPTPGEFELFMINADGTGETQLTDTPGLNGWAKWGVTREPCEGDESN
jgi:Tol biopolymer transport system component